MQPKLLLLGVVCFSKLALAALFSTQRHVFDGSFYLRESIHVFSWCRRTIEYCNLSVLLTLLPPSLRAGYFLLIDAVNSDSWKDKMSLCSENRVRFPVPLSLYLSHSHTQIVEICLPSWFNFSRTLPPMYFSLFACSRGEKQGVLAPLQCPSACLQRIWSPCRVTSQQTRWLRGGSWMHTVSW